MRYFHMNAARDEYVRRAQALMLPALLEAAKDDGKESHMHAVVERIEAIVLGMLADGRRDTAIDALKAMLFHPEDYLRGIAAREMVLLNDAALDGALINALKKGDSCVLYALVCGVREKNMREAVREGGQDRRAQNDREFDAASFSLMERFRKKRAVTPEDLRAVEAKLLEDAVADGELTSEDRMLMRGNMILLERELCRAKPLAGDEGFQRRQRAHRPVHASATAGNVARLHAAKPEEARRIPR
jgi:hypothetical protein